MKPIFTFIFSLFFVSCYAQGQWLCEIRLGFEDLTYWKFISIDTNSQNKWQIGHPDKTVFINAQTGTNAIVTDTAQPCVPGDTSSFILKIPIYHCFGFAGFSYWSNVNIASGDTAIMETSIDSGMYWKRRAVDTISTIGWTRKIFSASSLMPSGNVDSLWVRFRLITGNNSTSRDGWMIDSIVLGYWVENISEVPVDGFTIFPNPASDIISIKNTAQNTDEIQVSLMTAEGKTVRQKVMTRQQRETTIDAADLPSGLYYCTLRSKTGEVKKKITIIH